MSAFSIALINMREAITKAKELNKIEHALLLKQELDSWRLYGLKEEQEYQVNKWN
ncbi:MAG: hypothetical protein ACE1ZQ_04705 [Ignavibacteriaceae bacterium]|nr:hypothetical protein [Bacteroidota bacterium]